jgi:hypothetical protein
MSIILVLEILLIFFKHNSETGAVYISDIREKTFLYNWANQKQLASVTGYQKKFHAEHNIL